MQPQGDVPASTGQLSLTPNDRYGLLAGVVLVLVATLLVAIVGWQPVSALGLIIGVLLLIGVGIRSLRAARTRRVERALRAWGRDRGFLLTEAHGNPGTTPLLRRVGRLGPALIGPIGEDPAAVIAHCTATARGREDRHGDAFTIVVVRVPAAPGLGLRIGTHLAWTAAATDDWRTFATESMEIDERFSLEARKSCDPVALRSLLEPSVLAAMLDDASDVGIEVDDGTLVVWRAGHAGTTRTIDDLNHLLAHAEAWAVRLRDVVP